MDKGLKYQLSRGEFVAFHKVRSDIIWRLRRHCGFNEPKYYASCTYLAGFLCNQVRDKAVLAKYTSAPLLYPTDLILDVLGRSKFYGCNICRKKMENGFNLYWWPETDQIFTVCAEANLRTHSEEILWLRVAGELLARTKKILKSPTTGEMKLTSLSPTSQNFVPLCPT